MRVLIVSPLLFFLLSCGSGSEKELTFAYYAYSDNIDLIQKAADKAVSIYAVEYFGSRKLRRMK